MSGSPAAPRRIAFLQMAAKGDCLLATPILAELRRREPYAHITWVCFEEVLEVVRGVGQLLDDIYVWPLFSSRTRQEQELDHWPRMKVWCQKNFDWVVIPQCYPDHDWGYLRPSPLLTQMAIYANQFPLSDRKIRFNYDQQPADWKLVTANRDSFTAGAKWGVQWWQSLKGRLEDEGLKLVFGEDAGLTLKEWCSLISASRAYIGPDSGCTWLAAATPVYQIQLRKSSQVCPEWLTGLREMKVKEVGLTDQMVDPSPHAVAERVMRDQSTAEPHVYHC